MPTTHLHVPDLQSATDTAHLEKALEAVPHVRSVELETEAKQIQVEHDGANIDELTRALRQLGYSASAK
jgi:copper chaperone CopZ